MVLESFKATNINLTKNKNKGKILKIVAKKRKKKQSKRVNLGRIFRTDVVKE